MGGDTLDLNDFGGSLERALDVIWAVGYLDGEGALMTQQNGVEISVHSVDPRSLWRLEELFGGTLSYEEARTFTHKGAHRWRLYGNAARQCAAELLLTKQVTIKREQAVCLRDSRFYPKDSTIGQRLRKEALIERKQAYAEDGTPRR
jgi:hypothetical protein